MQKPVVYLVPSLLAENGLETIPAYVAGRVKSCHCFFVENERTARRYLKLLWKEIIIDDYEWFTIHKAETEVTGIFRQKLAEGKTVGIISEAGCPGIADPGQVLVEAAHQMNVAVRPLVGPSSILLALMASGLNGQRFQFNGYLPIDSHLRVQSIKEMEAESKKKNCTQVFIETPYRNNQLLEVLVKTCRDSTRLCLAVDVTGPDEWIKSKTIAAWRKEKTDIHKRPAIFLFLAG